MAENLEEYTPPEIVTQTDTSLEPPKKIPAEIKPDKNTNVPETQPILQTEKPVEQKPPIDPGELERAKEELKKMWVPEDIKERKDLLEENKPTSTSEPKLEIVENVGRRKIEEELAENIKINEEQQKEKDIKGKQQSGETLSTGDFAFIKGIENRRELSKTTEQEKKESAEKPAPKKELKEFDLSSTQIDTANVGEVSEEFSARTKELQQEQIKTARAGLEAQLQAINEAKEKKDGVAERSAFEEAKKLFEIVEGKKLAEEAVQRADVEIKQERLVKMSPEQYRQKYTERAEGQAEQIKKTNILEKRFSALSEQEKSKYTSENGLENFSKDMDAKIEAKRAELEKKGITISKNSFYAMMEEGLNPEQIKIVGLFSKKIEIAHKPLLAGRKGISERLSKDDFLNMTKESEKSFVSGIKKQAGAELQREIKRGQDLWRAKKNKCMRDVIKDTVDGYGKQQEPEIKESKPEPTEAEKNPEIASDINVEGVSSLKELYELLEKSGGITGGGGDQYSAEAIREKIEYLKKVVADDKSNKEGFRGGPLFSLITRNGGLRKKVEELLLGKKERKPKKSSKKTESE
jgi:hypothetical protein